MSSARNVCAPAGGRRLWRFAVVAFAVAASALLPGPAASADESGGTTVVGELLQAWPDEEHSGTAAGHEDDGPLSWVETSAGDSIRIPTEDVAGIPPGSTVSIIVGSPVGDEARSGDGHDPAREVLAADVVAATAAPPALSARAGLTNRVTLVLVTPGGVARDGATEQQVADVVNGPVADFWSEETDGAIEVGVTASHGWLSTVADCSDPAALWNEAAAAAGFEPGPGEHLLLYVSDAAADCSYALAEVGSGPASGGRMYVRDALPSLTAHELGHNFGLGHSSGRQCDGSAEAGACRTVGYRDYYDVMGASWAQMGSLNAPQAAQLGVLPATQLESLSMGGSAATVTLTPLSGRTGTRALRLIGADGVDYWLEYRSAAGRDAWLATADNRYGLETGVLLHRRGAYPDTSLLLDGTPGAAGGWDADLQAALPLGAAVAVSKGDFSVVLQSMSAAGAVLQVLPSPSPAAGVPAPAPVGAGAAPGGLMSAAGPGPAESGATEAAASALSAAPHVSGLLRSGGTSGLKSAADASTDAGSLLAVTGGLVTGGLLLAVWMTRRPRVRHRRALDLRGAVL